MPSSRRTDERVRIIGDLPGEVSVFERMTICEISRHGAQIETSVPLHLNSLHHFRLVFGDRTVVVQGRVVHSHVRSIDEGATIYLSGIEFVELSEPAEEAIDEFVRAIKDEREGT